MSCRLGLLFPVGVSTIYMIPGQCTANRNLLVSEKHASVRH